MRWAALQTTVSSPFAFEALACILLGNVFKLISYQPTTTTISIQGLALKSKKILQISLYLSCSDTREN